MDGCCYQKENEEIISSREDKETGLTWKEYKSMTFTVHVSRNNIWILFFFLCFLLIIWLVGLLEIQVINEALRISGGVGIRRRTKQDIQVNGT